MRLIFILNFLTLVLVFSAGIESFAAPDSEIYPTEPRPLQKQWADQGATLSPTRSNFNHSNTIYLGHMSGNLVDKGENRSTDFIGMQRTNYNSDFSAQEYGVDLTRLGLAGFNLGWKKLLYLSDWNEPYYKISLAGLYKPAETLASFINIDRYHIRGSIGFDDFLSLQRCLRLDASVAYSLLGFSYGVSVGYSFPD